MIDTRLDELTKDVLAHSDMVGVISSYIHLTRKGRNYWAPCPFHDDNNPSLSVNPEKRIWKCWVCGFGGTEINFVQRYEKIGYFEALKKVAEINGFVDPRLEGFVKQKPVDEKKVPLLKALNDLTIYYQYALNTEEGKEGLDYFETRHLDAACRAKYRLGYSFKDGKATCDFLQSKGHSLKTIDDIGIAVLSNGNYVDKSAGRVIFPICDADGNVIGYSARRLGNGTEAKYVNSPETYLFHKSNVLYNYHIAKEKAKLNGYVYVCEGFMDVFALGKIGIDNAVALMGTALTKEHITMLRSLNCEVRLCLDGDLPGQKAMMEASKALAAAGINVRIVDNQNSPKDPDEILNQDGEEALRRYVNNLVNRIDFALNYFKNTNPLTTLDSKKALIKQFIPILLDIKSQLELDSYLIKLSGVTGFEVQAIRDLLKRARVEAKQQNVDPSLVIRDFHPERKVLRRLALAERELLYQMLNNQDAIYFYEENVGAFYDDVYREVANYVIDYAKIHDEFNMHDIMSSLEMSELENKDSLVREVVDMSFEEMHNKKCTPELLENLLSSIEEEKDKIFEKDTLEASMNGKDPMEKARILAEYNRRKMRKIEEENKKKEGGK
ncbi:MAG: DNA primase [Bacilli bacterium]|nr:DNA primase [Bacilli bacterium]